MTLGSSVEVARNEMGGVRRLDISVLVGIMHGRRRIARILMARSIRADFSVGLHGILMPLVFMPIVLKRASFTTRNDWVRCSVCEGSACRLNRIEVGQPLVAHT